MLAAPRRWTLPQRLSAVLSLEGFTVLVALALASGAAPVRADDEPIPDLPEVDEEPIPDLPTVEAPLDPIRQLVGMAANPQLPIEEGQKFFEDIVRRGPLALTSLAQLFRDPSSSDREAWVAARALGRIGGEGARRTLVDGLTSPRVICRLGAVSGLTTLKDKESAQALEGALFDQAMTVRAAAADALAAIGMKRSARALSNALDLPANFHQGRSLFVRRHIVVALGKIGSIYGIEMLVKTLRDPEPEIQLAALSALEGTTGMSFRDASVAPDAPPDPEEIAAWDGWWSKRQVAEPGRTSSP